MRIWIRNTAYYILALRREFNLSMMKKKESENYFVAMAIIWKQELTTSVADPHHFDVDPDPAFKFDADPDPTNNLFPQICTTL